MKHPNTRLPLGKIRRALHRHMRWGARGKAAFQLAGDALDEALALSVPLDEPITLPGGRVVIVRDAFAQRNDAFSAKLFRRYKVEDVKETRGRASRPQVEGSAS